MNHKQKLKLARKMAGKKNKTGVFLTDTWFQRKQNIKKGVENKNKRIKKAVEKKKEELKKLLRVKK